MKRGIKAFTARSVCVLTLLLVAGILTVGSPAGAGLVVYYNFNDSGTSATATDTSGLGHDGTISGATYTADGGGQSGVTGDRAMNFQPSQGVAIPAAGTGGFASITANDAATVSLWIYGDTTQPRSDSAFGFDNAASGRVLQSHLPWSGGTIYWDIGNNDNVCCGGGERISKLESDPNKYRGGWNYYTFVKEPGTGSTGMKIYQNGALWHQGSAGVNLGTIVNGFVGRDPDGNYYDGQIDDFAVYDTAISPQTIAAMATGQLADGVTYSDPIVGSNAYTKSGSGTAILAADNKYTGRTIISEGTLQIGAGVPGVPQAVYTFDSVSGSTVANEGTLGGYKDGELSSGATIVGGGIRGNAMENDDYSDIMLISSTANRGVSFPDGEWTASGWFNGLKPSGNWRTLFRGYSSDHHIIVENTSETLGEYTGGF